MVERMGSEHTTPQEPDGETRAVDRSRRRLLDASLNRCAEALRVAEDICRFHLEAGAASRELKELRHAILGLFVPDPSRRAELASARDIVGDLGRDIPSPPPPEAGESGEESATETTDSGDALLGTAVRNLERAKEALRSLEEVSRITHAERCAAVEKLRYQLYAVEKGLLHRAGRHDSGRMLGRRLCLLATSAHLRGPARDILGGAIEGGVDVIQLREKELSDQECLRQGRLLRELTSAAGIPLIVNDRPDLALILQADGLHLGQDDLPLATARTVVGDDMIVGLSTHSTMEARKAMREGADYIGIGPVFPTTTKEVGPVLGPAGFRDIVQHVDVPAFAIGGITPQNIGELAAVGARSVAVSAAILQARSGTEARDLAAAMIKALE